MENNVEELISEALDGSDAAFEQIMVLFERRVFSICLKITCSVEEAKDATQDTFLKVFRFLHKYKKGKDFGAWISRIAVNCCYDIVNNAFEKADNQENGADDLNAIPDGNYTPGTETLLDNKKAMSALMEVLKTLPIKQRTIFILKEMEGYSTGEAAKISGSSGITVRRNLSEARTKVKNALMERFPELFADYFK